MRETVCETHSVCERGIERNREEEGGGVSCTWSHAQPTLVVVQDGEIMSLDKAGAKQASGLSRANRARQIHPCECWTHLHEY